MLQRSEELSLCVVDEEDNETLLVHPINTEDIYRKQEGRPLLAMLSLWFLFVFGVDKVVFCQCTDTIISWRDPERSTELALSFQETAGCSYVWLVK